MTLEQRVCAVIRENSEDTENIPLKADLQHDLGIDSFGRMMIVNGIEDMFSITVDEEDIALIKTVEDIVRLLRSKYAIKDQNRD